MNADGSLVDQPSAFNPTPAHELVAGQLINHFNVYAVAAPRQMAEWYNRLQKMAERTRLAFL